MMMTPMTKMLQCLTGMKTPTPFVKGLGVVAMQNCVLDSVETMFSKGFLVYTQDDNEIRYRSARLLRHPLPGMDHIVNVHLEGDQHFRRIENLQMYAHKQARAHVCLPGEQCARTRGPHCNFIYNGCSQRLVDDMMACLSDMSDAAYRLTRDTMHPYWSQLDKLGLLSLQWDIVCMGPLRMLRLKRAACLVQAQELVPWLKCGGALEQWICMPGGLFQWRPLWPAADQAILSHLYGTHAPPLTSLLLGVWGPWIFGGRYGRYVTLGQARGWDSEHPEEGSSCFTAIYTHKLAFLDVWNYLPVGGFSYAKYLRTYGGTACQGGKSFFPYEYVDALGSPARPLLGYAAFYLSLRSENTHWKRAWDEICWYIITITTWYPSWQPYRSSATSTSKQSCLVRPVMCTGPSSWTSWHVWGPVPGTQHCNAARPVGCMMRRHRAC